MTLKPSPHPFSLSYAPPPFPFSLCLSLPVPLSCSLFTPPPRQVSHLRHAPKRDSWCVACSGNTGPALNSCWTSSHRSRSRLTRNRWVSSRVSCTMRGCRKAAARSPAKCPPLSQLVDNPSLTGCMVSELSEIGTRTRKTETLNMKLEAADLE